MMYLSVRLGCAVYLLYKVWGQKARIREWCDLLYTPVKKEETVPAVSGDEPDVMGSTRFVYLDEDAGKTAAPFMSHPLEMGTDYLGEEEGIPSDEVECSLPLEKMRMLQEEQEDLERPVPETDAVTQAVTLDDLSLVGDVLMKVDGADRDNGKASAAAGPCLPSGIRTCSTCLFPRLEMRRRSTGCWRSIWMRTDVRRTRRVSGMGTIGELTGGS